MPSIRPEDWSSPALAPGLADRTFGVWVKVPLVAGVDTAGGIFAWTAPVDCFVDRVIVDATTPATGTCLIDVGTTAVSAATLSDNLIDGADIHTAAVATDNYLAAGANGKAM